MRSYPNASVVFCRLDEIDKMDDPELSEAVERLDSTIKDLIAGNPRIRMHSNVFGAFVVMPEPMKKVMQLANRIRRKCAERHVRVAIGVSDGRLEPVADLTEENVVGTAINYAARLAFVDHGPGRIAVKESTAQQAMRAGLARWFGEPQTGTVKATQLKFRWLQEPGLTLLPLGTERPRARGRNSKVAYVLVYDLKGYSGRGDEAQLDLFKKLHQIVRDALEAAGANLNSRDWYSPAGDGGAVVFGESPRALWTFACTLSSYARAEQLDLRIGIDHGEVHVLKDFGRKPVGTPIINADRFCGGSPVGGILTSLGYKKLLIGKDIEQAERFGLTLEELEDSVVFKPRFLTQSQQGLRSSDPRALRLSDAMLHLHLSRVRECPAGWDHLQSMESSDPMTIIICDTESSVARTAARFMIETIRRTLFPRIGLFTGRAANHVYSAFVDLFRAEKQRAPGTLSFRNVESFVDGEFLGLEPDHLRSYQTMTNRDLLSKMKQIDGTRGKKTYFVRGTFGDDDVESHCNEINLWFRGRIHTQLMGFAPDGQSMFLSPSLFTLGDLFTMGASLVRLSRPTYDYITPKGIVPYVITVGSGNILHHTDRVVLVGYGEQKGSIVKDLVLGPVTPARPVTILRKHRNLILVTDQAAARQLPARLPEQITKFVSGSFNIDSFFDK